MAKDERVGLRMPTELKRRFAAAAAMENMDISKWLRSLGERRLRELHLEHERVPLAPTKAAPPNGPAAAFVPGFGLDIEEEG